MYKIAVSHTYTDLNWISINSDMGKNFHATNVAVCRIHLDGRPTSLISFRTSCCASELIALYQSGVFSIMTIVALNTKASGLRRG